MNSASYFLNNTRTEKKTWDLLEITALFPRKVYRKGELIFRQGQLENHVYFLLKGKVLLFQHNYIFGKEMTLGLFCNGDFINPEIVSGNPGSNRYAVAKAESTVLEIPILNFVNLMDQHPFLSRLVVQGLATRQQETSRQLQYTELMSTRQRILHFLVYYAEKAGRVVGFERVVRNILTHQELGSLCQASRQSVTTLLNDLRKQNIIRFNRRYLLIHDLELLREMALSDHLQND